MREEAASPCGDGVRCGTSVCRGIPVFGRHRRLWRRRVGALARRSRVGGRRELHRIRSYGFAVAAFAVSSTVLVFLFNAAMASLLDFGFWKRSLALVAVHRWNEPAPCRMLTPFICSYPWQSAVSSFFCAGWWLSDRTAVITARAGFLLSAFAFAVLAMQSGLVRSDANHIVFAIFPMVFFAGAVLISFRSRLVSLATAVAAIVASRAVCAAGGSLPAIKRALSLCSISISFDQVSKRVRGIRPCLLSRRIHRDAPDHGELSSAAQRGGATRS